ncbi:phenylalanine--tRNA ligase subunit alpha [candidate division WWE3 bacterium CG08_land_8_20_14_0_20_41_10]|uniref:phenylalanine--tRNA ligase n=1 Tax=candidate division WWE3 bacterium CG08_land_8_20_14_0_20_41_10 TaxID=1975085 RepID=A0A2H0XCS2_UNCKA|nr:MAG: phenylalanine--tRNA ligase subunit alpha [candidate division WWE3 bacterium CG08_land_8_20_14_0_20_41_10]
MEIDQLANQFNVDLQEALKTGKFDELYLKYLSKTHGLVTQKMKELPNLSPEEKKEVGPKLNALKKYIEERIEKGRHDYQQAQITNTDIDLTIPYPPANTGYLHPTTQIIRQMNNFFRYYGFSVGEGPEIETAQYNFRRLNLPEGHPATDLQDTLFVNEPDILLRTHTSSIEARILENYQPPIRVVAPGKCYRNETANPTNSSFFHQYQGFVVDKGITMQNLRWLMEKFHQYLFDDVNIELRFRYKYYPEVSPGMGVDVICRFCNGTGCAVCKQRGWMEILGCGMIHYNTLKMSGIDPEIYTGFAWGMGLDRLVMAKFGISDIRKLYGGLAYI